MNYLAHLYLGDRGPGCLIGSLLGDFVKGRVSGEYPVDLRLGILLHRKIDAYTDAHATVAECRRLIGPANRRYAGVVIDIAFDHFLAREWDRYSPERLPAFTARVYDTLGTRVDEYPDRMRQVVRTMIASDRLGSYHELSGITAALERLSRWVPGGAALPEATRDLELHYDRLGAAFQSFFPDVCEQCSVWAADILVDPSRMLTVDSDTSS